MRSLEGGLKIVWYVILLAPLLRKLVIGFWSGFSLRCRSASASKWTRFEPSLLHSVILPLDGTKKVHCKEFNCVWLNFFYLFLNFNWLLEHLLCHLTYFFIFLLQMPDVGPVYSQSHSGSRRSNVIPGLLQRQSGLWPCQVHILLLKLLFDMKNIWGFFFFADGAAVFYKGQKNVPGLILCCFSTPILFTVVVRVALDRAAVLLSLKSAMVRLDNVWGVGGGLRPVKHLIKEVWSA